jgi:hypothetical protein
MKDRVIEIMSSVVALLRACGEFKRAEWFLGRAETLRKEPPSSIHFRDTLIEIRGILGGMGSFSDLSLTPVSFAEFSPEEARHQQWQLTENLSLAIDRILSRPERPDGDPGEPEGG